MSKLLYPLAWLYGWAVALRNRLYDWGVFRSYRSPLKVILVGNLSVGGTGKTPAVEWLLEHLSGRYSLAVLSRGYGRASSKPHLARPGDGPRELGDEPTQIFQRFPQVPLLLDGNRKRALNQMEGWNRPPEVVVMDDGFQHRAITAGLPVVLTTWSNPFHRDHLLPVGRLRESGQGIRRAGALIVTKCPTSLGSAEKEKFRNELTVPKDLPVFFTTLAYGAPRTVKGTPTVGPALLITGIADPAPLAAHLKSQGREFHHRRFADHHAFTPAEITRLERESQMLGCQEWLTTEKDWTRLSNCRIPEGISVTVIPVHMSFSGEDEAAFSSLLNSYLEG